MRLMQSEVQTFKHERLLKDEVSFPGGSTMTYSIKMSGSYGAEFGNSELILVVPTSDALEWINSEELSLRSSLQIEGGSSLSLLIEKDLECLMPREGEDESDAYPNPKKENK